MELDPVINFGKVEVSIGYDASATSIVLSSGDGAKLPSTFSYNLVWWNFTDYRDPSDDPNVEIVRVSARSTDTLTLSDRAQEGTAATTKNTAGKTYKMILSVTKKMIDDIASGGSVENLVINGDMRIAQRGTSFVALTASQYTLDMMEWIDTGTTAGVVTPSQDTDVPTVAEAGIKFPNSLKIDVTTAEDLGAGNAALYLSHKIEAQNVTFFGHGATGALSGTLSFWFKSTKTGIFTVNVDRDDATKKYSTEFTVGTTNTWEKHTVTIPGDTSGAAIADDNGIGLALQFMMAIGATGKTSTPDAWNASGSTELATSNQVNLLDNTSNNVLITGIQYELGSTASDFDSRDIASELVRAQRYLPAFGLGIAGNVLYGMGYMNTTTEFRIVFNFPTMVRSLPTSVITTTASNFTAQLVSGVGVSASAIALSSIISLNSAMLTVTVSTATLGHVGVLFNASNGLIYFEGCEL